VGKLALIVVVCLCGAAQAEIWRDSIRCQCAAQKAQAIAGPAPHTAQIVGSSVLLDLHETPNSVSSCWTLPRGYRLVLQSARSFVVVVLKIIATKRVLRRSIPLQGFSTHTFPKVLAQLNANLRR